MWHSWCSMVMNSSVFSSQSFSIFIFCRYCSIGTVIFTFCISNATMGRFVITLYRIFYIKGHSILKGGSKERQMFWVFLSLSFFLNTVTSASFYIDQHHRNFLYYNLCVRNIESKGVVTSEEVMLVSAFA